MREKGTDFVVRPGVVYSKLDVAETAVGFIQDLKERNREMAFKLKTAVERNKEMAVKLKTAVGCIKDLKERNGEMAVGLKTVEGELEGGLVSFG